MCRPVKGVLKQESVGLRRNSNSSINYCKSLVEVLLKASVFLSFIKERLYLLWVAKLTTDNKNTNEYKWKHLVLSEVLHYIQSKPNDEADCIVC